MTILLQLTDVTKKYKNKFVLQDVSLNIEKGSFVCLLGPPGAGKSTLLRIIAGTEKPSSGKVLMNGEDITERPPWKRNISMVFQTFALYNHMTVYDNIANPLRAARMDERKIESRTKEVAQLLRIDSLLDKLPTQLSGGEKQRVAIARAIARERDLYLFDEPLTNLDLKIRVELRVELKRVQRELGKAIIYATSDPVEALAMANKVAVINQGKIEQYDEKENVYFKPSNLFVGKYFGYPEMNTFVCSLVSEAGKMLADAGPFKIDLTPFNEAISKLTTSKLIVGIRPECLKISQYKVNQGQSIEGKIVLCDVQGSETVVHVDCGEGLIIQVFVPEIYKMELGANVKLTFDPANLYIFDGTTLCCLNNE